MKRRGKVNKVSRNVHDQVALWSALPILVIVVSGLLLQVRKEFSWIQPPTQQGTPFQLELSPPEILEIVKKSPDASIQSWQDIDRLDIRPSKGLVKVRAKNRWEWQIDMRSGQILQQAYRRSDLIESIHDGSFFHEYARLGLFLPMGFLLFVLWITGMCIFMIKRLKKGRGV